MSNIEENIVKWENRFNTYLEFDNKCVVMIDEINNIKLNLKNLLGNQKKDDIIFYNSLIDNSFFYLSSSLKIRKTKLLKDLNYIWNQFDDKKTLKDLNKTDFAILMKDYKKLADEITSTKQHNTMLKWVKNDRFESLQEAENELNEIFEYHLKLMEHFFNFVDLEKKFYCENKN